MKISLGSLYNWYRNAIRNPKYRWWIVIGTVVYLISPFDFLPDFIPIAGEIDDFMIATLLVTEISQIVLEKFKSRQQAVNLDRDSATASQETVDVKVETVAPNQG